MAKYVCKNLGICDHANEEVEVLAGSEPKCPHCDMALHLLGDDGTIGGKHDGAAGRSGGRRISIAVAIALILLGGTGYFAYSAKVNNDRQASSPTPAISSSDGNGKVGATVGLSPNESEVRALRAEGDAKLVRGDSASSNASVRAAALETIKIALVHIKKGEFSEAEKDLNLARDRAPKEPLVYYNMAVLRVKQKRMDDAFKELEASFISGFTAFNKMDEDTDISDMQKDPRYSVLMARYRPTAAK